ncbi:MAG TPA: hypothetical protein VJ183_12935 [Chloroflexia bacterium]|nr:hypothetical protein [Chloroflexia bacterium]
MKDLFEHITKKFEDGLSGAWVLQEDKYEAEFAKALDMELAGSRQGDCLWTQPATGDKHIIELKKGQRHFHFDLVRYSEYLLNPQGVSIITVLGVYKKDKKDSGSLLELHAVKVSDLLERLHLNPDDAQNIVNIAKKIREAGSRKLENGAEKAGRNVLMPYYLTKKEVAQIEGLHCYKKVVKKQLE